MKLKQCELVTVEFFEVIVNYNVGINLFEIFLFYLVMVLLIIAGDRSCAFCYVTWCSTFRMCNDSVRDGRIYHEARIFNRKAGDS